jgi:predicted MFS family arabinose efflux permease
MVYGGVLHFLPRYLSEANVFSGWLTSADEAALGNYTAAIALICGAFGQWVAGRLATPNRLPLQLSAIYGLNIPFLIWMTFAEGTARLIAACLWAFFHFMNQPVYNSLLPEYLPRRRRSAGYGFSNLMGFGVGAVGPYIVAQCGVYFPDYTYSYLTLAGLAAIATVLPLPLIRHRHQERT